MAQKKTSFLKTVQSRAKQIDVRGFFSSLPKNARYKKTVAFMHRKPMTAFLIGLGILFGVIALGNILNGLTKTEESHVQAVKDVQTYALNGNPSVTVQAKVEKEGVIQILAQTAGIVNSVNFTEGDEVHQGHVFVQLASNYQGGNAPALQASIAQETYNNTNVTYNTQKEVIQKQREIADKTEANADELRRIASESAGDTQSLLDLNLSLLRPLEDELRNLENTNVNGSNDAAIAALRAQISPVKSGVVQLQTQLRSLNYQKEGNKPAAELGVLQRDLTKKQLDVQERALELGLRVSKLQADLAWVQASLMAPAAPCHGIIEKIFVKPGDSVNPGDPIATIKTNNNQATLEALVPSDVAFSVSTSASSSAVVNRKTIQMQPYYVSREATDGQLYSVLFSLPENVTGSLSNGQYVPVTIPLAMVEASSEPYVPLDAVYQTQSEAYVYVAEGNKAVSKKVTLGEVYGKFVTVVEGLSGNDHIILNRNIVAGETIKLTN